MHNECWLHMMCVFWLCVCAGCVCGACVQAAQTAGCLLGVVLFPSNNNLKSSTNGT